MTTEEAVKFYGTKTAVADALGISKSCVTEWGNEPPMLRQYQLQELTKGKLKLSRKRK